MAPALDDLSGVEDHDAVGVPYRGETVSDDGCLSLPRYEEAVSRGKRKNTV